MKKIHNIFDAINKQNLKSVKWVLRNYPHQIHSKEPKKGFTALHKAISIGNIEIVKEILSKYPPLEPKNLSGYTPLLLACMANYTEIAILLINAGANVNTKVEIFNHTPLYCAASNKNILLTEKLIIKGANVNQADLNKIVSNRFIIEDAVDHTIVEILKIFMKSGYCFSSFDHVSLDKFKKYKPSLLQELKDLNEQAKEFSYIIKFAKDIKYFKLISKKQFVTLGLPEELNMHIMSLLRPIQISEDTSYQIIHSFNKGHKLNKKENFLNMLYKEREKISCSKSK